MLKLDNNLLDELGLGGLPEDQKRAMLQHIYDTLELRVGTNLANQMTDQQLEEFERFIDNGGDANQAQALQWLEANLPNYKQVVSEVFEALKAEIKQMAPQIMASSMSQPPIGPTVASAPSLQTQYQTQASVQTSPMPLQPQGVPAQYHTTVMSPQPQPLQGSSPAYQVPQTQTTPIPIQPQPVIPNPMAALQQAPSVASPAMPDRMSSPQVPPAAPGSFQQPVQPQQDTQVYQFPVQQPPAGPGDYQRPPQYPDGRQAA